MTNISSNKTNAYMALLKLSKKRRLILGGSMDTQIQKFKLKDRHYGGKNNKSNKDILNITQPRVIEKIHLSYLEAGADIIVTNTFNSNQITQSSYNNNYSCLELNRQAVLIAKRARLKYSFRTKRRVFVAGSVGPTNKSLTLPFDALKMTCRDVTFDEVVSSYKQQINTLLSMDVNMLLIETVFDVLNLKAALFAYLEISRTLRNHHALVISVTIDDAFGRTLYGQTLEAFWHSISHVELLGVGINCTILSKNLKQYVSELSSISGRSIWIYPNVSFKNKEDKYIQNVDNFAKQIKTLIKHACVLGGCCGSTPEHISRLVEYKLSDKLIKDTKTKVVETQQSCLFLSGLEALKINRNEFYKIGEQASVSGSKKFRSMINSGNYKQALDIVRQQIIHGAKIININMDDPLLNSEVEMLKFLNLINIEPDLSALPIMIDSSKWSTLLAGMKHIQGKGIINSISLKEGDTQFMDKARLIKMHGCLPVVVASDERERVLTIDQRLIFCKRVRKLLVKEVGFTDEEIIIDLNTFVLSSGSVDHNGNAINLIKTMRLVGEIYPKINLVLGISNLSLAFRGNNRLREALHSVFIRYAKLVRLNLGILNVQKQISYNKLNTKIKNLCASLISEDRQITTEEIFNVFDIRLSTSENGEDGNNWRNWSINSRLIHAIIMGNDKHIEHDLMKLVKDIGALQVIEGPLKDGTNIVWKLFGNGMMVLFQILKSARIIKKILISIIPLIENKRLMNNKVIVLVTMRSSVHDLEKNIINTILSCNNYNIIDLGTMFSSDEIVQEAIKYKANVIGITGLVSSSLDKVMEVVRLMRDKSLDIPLFVVGESTCELYTIIKLNPEYPNGIVIYVKDANEAIKVVFKLFDETSGIYIKTLKLNYELTTKTYNESKQKQHSIPFKVLLNHSLNYNRRVVPNISFIGTKASFVGNLKGINISNEINEKDIVSTKIIRLRKKILSKMISERWVSIRRIIGMMKAVNRHRSICILGSNNSLIVKLPMLRQQQSGETCLSLCDFIDKNNDNISAYCCVLGIEATLIHQYFNVKNRFQCAYVFKRIYDDLIETSSKNTYDVIRYNIWAYACKHSHDGVEGKRIGIRLIPGCSSVPDHRIKHSLFRILSLKSNTGLMISNTWSYLPQTSILSMVVANPYAINFRIDHVDKHQIISYSKLLKQTVESTKKSLNPLICLCS